MASSAAAIGARFASAFVAVRTVWLVASVPAVVGLALVTRGLDVVLVTAPVKGPLPL